MAILVLYNARSIIVWLGLSLSSAAVAQTNNPMDMQDQDGDGLRNGEEVASSCDPARADTDGDGLWDGTEVALGLNPATAQTEEGLNDAELDSDDDGYSNLEEQSSGYGPADPYDSPAVSAWPQQNNWADGSTLWQKNDPEETP